MIALFCFQSKAQTAVDFTHSKNITVHSAQVEGSTVLNDFAFLFDAIDPDFRSIANGGHMTSLDGFDIWFTLSDGVTAIDYEMESYDPTTGKMVVWLETNLNPIADTELIIYFGSTTVTTDRSSPNAWNADYSGVFHVEPDGSFANSATGGLDLSSTFETSGIINTAAEIQFAPRVTGMTGDYSHSGNLTLESWVNITSVSTGRVNLFSHTSNVYFSADNNSNYNLSLNTNTGILQMTWSYGNNIPVFIAATEPITLTGWHHIAVSRNVDAGSREVIFYMDGQQVGNVVPIADSDLPASGSQSRLGIGHDPENAGIEEFGAMDEVRIASAVLSSERIQTYYNSVSSPNTFFSLSDPNCDGSFTYPDSEFCDNSPSIAATIVGESGGTFSSPDGKIQIDDINTGLIDFSGSEFGGPFGIVYTLPTGCTDTFEITINETTPSPNAGPDQFLCARSTQLDANDPVTGIGEWSVISGQTTGFGFSDVHLPNAHFRGEIGEVYDLRWTITTPCGAESDEVVIDFASNDFADAGIDQWTSLCGSTSTTLQGSLITTGIGTWDVLSGQASSDWTLDDAGVSNSDFSGVQGETYSLRWTVTDNGCTSMDTVEIRFPNVPDAVNAGIDQSICGSVTTTTLSASAPTIGTAEWSIVSGAAGNIDDITDANSAFSGTAGETYILEWTNTEDGCTTSDQVSITIAPSGVADAGTNNFVCNTSTTLTGNDVSGLSMNWSLVSGTGTITNPNDASSSVTGLSPGTNVFEYELGCTTDQVKILVDSVGPELTLPPNLTFYTDDLCSGVPSSNEALFSYLDDCPDSSGFSDILYTSMCEGHQEIKRVWSATDAIGNTTVDTQYIEIIDTIKPSFIIPATIVLYTPAVGCGVDMAPTNTGQPTDLQDNCSSSPSFNYVDSDNGTSCMGVPNTFYREWTITDDCGNSISETQIIVVRDTTKPNLVATADQTLYKPANSCAITLPSGESPSSVDDNCSAMTSSPTFVDEYQNLCAGSADLFRIWSVVDQCGNVAVDTQFIYIRDTVAPQFISTGNDTTLYYSAACDLPNTLAQTIDQLGASWGVDDNCDSAPVLAWELVDTLDICAGSQTYTIRWTTSDDCSNSRFLDQLLTVSDTVAPTFTLPADAIVYQDAGCLADTDTSLVVGTVRDESDGCSLGLDATYTDEILVTCSQSAYNIERTWVLTDDCGNSTSGIQLIEVRDTTPPAFNPPADIIVYLDMNCAYDVDPSITGSVLLSADNCASIRDTSYVDAITPGSCDNELTITRTWTLSDSCGNVASAVQIISIEDTIAPTFDIDQNVVIYSIDDCTYDASTTITGSPTNLVDNCTGFVLTPTFIESSTTGSCQGEVIVTRVWSLVDACGNTSSQTQTITIQDTTSPTFTVPRDTVLYRNIDCDNIATRIALLGDVADEDDNCSTGIEATHSDVQAMICGSDYEIIRTWTLVDNCNNSTLQVQRISVRDTIAPTFTVPRDTTLFLDGNCIADTSFVGTNDVYDELDNCSTGLDAIYQDSVVREGCEGSFVVYRKWELADDCNNINRQTQVITVMDDVPPIFITPQSDTLYLDANCFADTTLTGIGNIILVEDNCDVSLDTAYSDVITTICEGSFRMRRTWTLTDGCNNSTSRDQWIVVLDTIRPTFTTPNDTTIYLANCTLDDSPANTGDVTDEMDNCSTGLDATFTDGIINGCGSTRIITRQWELRDACGNSSGGVQTITFLDTLSPTFTAPPTANIYIDGTCNVPALLAGDVTDEADNCPGFGQATYTDVTLSSTCSGSYSIIRTWTMTDACSNSTSHEQTINIIDTLAPVMTLPANVTLYADINCRADTAVSQTGSPTMVSDNCDVSPVVSMNQTIINGGCSGSYQIERTWTAVDDCGNTASSVQTIEVIDSTPPTINIPANQVVYYDDMCDTDTTVAATGIASSGGDNCSTSIAPMYTDIIDNECGSNFTIRRTWTTRDDCGNISAQVQLIEVRDTIRPELDIPIDRTYYIDNVCTAIDTTPAVTGMATNLMDNCTSSPVLSYIDTYADDCGSGLTISRTWSLVDECGNTSSETQTIQLLDTISPVLTGIPADTHFQCATPTDPPVIGVDILATDNCDPNVDIAFSESSTRTFDNSCTDVIYTITRTWTATDACGNSTVRTQIITASCECCNNGIDDDGDGSIDESDSDCPCTTSEVSLSCDGGFFYFIPSVWRMTGGNFDGPSKLTVTTPNGTANYNIRTADGSFDQNRTVTQGAADVINLNTNRVLTTGANQVEDDKGFIIESDQPIQVLYQLDGHFNKLLITYKGEQALGQRFRTASQTNLCGLTPRAADENHFISVMAAEDGTEVTFDFDMPLYGITSPHTVTLDAGETYLVRDNAWANQTVSGALVTSSRPVAVVSGSQHTVNCNATGGTAPGRDGGADQLVPTCLVGTDYLAVRGRGENYSNYVIIVGVSASTGIYINGGTLPIATVGPGEYYEYQLPGTDGDPHYIRTDRPAYAYQVGNLTTKNEPGMSIMSPIGACIGETSIEFTEFAGSENGVNVLVPTSALATLSLNGANYTTFNQITTAAVPNLPIYTSVNIPDAHISSYNRVEADERFIAFQYVGDGGSGTYGYLTSFKDEVVITNPSTGTADFSYSLDTLCGGIVFNHCVDATSCAGGLRITDVIPGPHTTSVSFDPTGGNTCFSYIGEPGYNGFDEITVYIADLTGLISAICVDIYLCGTTPFIETIPADTLILCNEIVPAPPVFIPINAGCSQSFDLTFDADSTITYTGSCTDYAFTITRSWTLLDNCGNDTTVYQVITIADTINPILVIPPDTLLFADGICAIDTLVSQLGEAEDIADNCDPNLHATYIDSIEVNPTCTGSFSIYRKWMVIDDCGNIYTNIQTIDIRDTIKPEFVAPRDTAVYVNDMCNAQLDPALLGSPTNATDNCDVGLMSTYVDAETPSCTGNSTITRTWRVTDDCGNYSEETQTIQLFDTIGPELILPSDTTLYFDVSCMVDTTASMLGSVSTNDNCGTSSAPIYRDSTVMNCDRNYTTFRIWSATDNCGNLSTQIQTIVVLDTIQPTMVIPGDITIYKDDFCNIDTTTAVTGIASNEADNCSPLGLVATYTDDVVVNCELGFTVRREWRVEDLCGNVTTEIQTITVIDSILPAFDIPRDTVLYNDVSCFADTSIVDLGVAQNLSDNCDNNPSLSYHDDVTIHCDGQYDINRVWALTDDCGNIHRDTQFISVLDTIDPFFITPSNVTLFADDNCVVDTSLTNTGGARFENDNCDLTLTPTYVDSIGAGCGVGYEIFRIWQVLDDCGNQFRETQVITVIDRIAPSFTTPSDTTLYADLTCFADTTTSSTGFIYDQSDNCATALIAFYDDIVTPTCEGSYQIERTWSLEDECGNATTDIQIITVLDTVPPTFTTPSDTLIYAQASCQLDTAITQVGAATDVLDNCNLVLTPTYSDEINSSCAGNQIVSRIWRLEDDCGNVTIDTQRITILDTIRPVFTIPSDTTIYVDMSCNVNTTITVTGDVLDESDNCDNTAALEATHTDAQIAVCGGSYDIERRWSLTDDCGNTTAGIQLIHIVDTIAPDVTLPPDVTIYKSTMCTADTSVATIGVPVSSDNCAGSITTTHLNIVDVDDPCQGAYTITRIWTSRDLCGNTAVDTQFISVLDTLEPTFTTPADITIYKDASCSIDTLPTTTGDVINESDNCSTGIEATYVDVITNNCTGDYNIERTWSLTDDCGNLYESVQLIEVRDTISPTFTVPSDTTVYVDINCLQDTSELILGDVLDESDNCSKGIEATYADAITVVCSGTYSIERTWSLIDDCGNESSVVQTIQVLDTVRPELVAPSDTVAYLDLSCAVDTVSSSTGMLSMINDNCPGTTAVTYDDIIITDCGASFTINRIWKVTDDCNNIDSVIQVITVLDSLAPNFTVPQDTVIYTDASCTADTDPISAGDVTDESDNCSTGIEAIHADDVTQICAGEYTIERTWSLEDDCGNRTEYIQTITIRDTIQPTFTTPADFTVYKDASCSIDTLPTTTGDIINESDNCSTGIEATYADVITDNCTGDYSIERTWSLTDDCGNLYESVQLIEVRDTISPTFTVPSDTTVYVDINCLQDTSELILGDVLDESDNCSTGIEATYADAITVVCSGTYTIERTWSLLDDCGNESLVVQTIQVLDTVRPELVAPSDTVAYLDLSCAVDTASSSTGMLSMINDNCPGTTAVTYDDIITTDCGSSFTINRIWKVTDDCNNVDSVIQLITVLDSLAPTFTVPQDTVIYTDASCTADTDPISAGDVTDESDNCSTGIEAIHTDDVTQICAGEYTIERTWSLEDDCGNRTEFIQTITIRDTISPTFDLPGDITLSVTSMCAVDTSTTTTGILANIDDNCASPSDIDISYVDAVTTGCTGSFSIERTWTAEDACGNTTSAVQVISVNDDQAPTFDAPADTTVYLDVSCMSDTLAIDLGAPSNLSDGCDTSLIFGYHDVITTACGGSYTISRTWTVSDDCMNSAAAVQMITVLDTIAPNFVIPSDTTVYKLPDCTVSISPTDVGDASVESDNCDTGLDATYVDTVQDDCTGSQTITRTWTLTDLCGNDTSAVQVITILDTLRPSFTVPADTTIYKDLNCNADIDPLQLGDVTDEMDNCDTGLDATYVDTVQDDCAGSQTITRTWTLTDACGNTNTADQMISVLDTSAPSFVQPRDTTIYVDVACQVDSASIITGIPTGITESCSGTTVNYSDDIAVSCSGSFVITRSWSVGDLCGNTQTQIQTITVLDTLAPTFTPPADTTLYANQSCIADTSIVNTGYQVTSLQECETNVEVNYSDNIITICGGSYTLERTWEVSDPCGNVEQGVQTITVIDTIAPEFTAPVDTTLYVDEFCLVDTMITSTGTIVNSTDNCDNLLEVLYIDTIRAVCTGSYTIERTWLVSDECANIGSSIQMITILDTVAPDFVTPIDLTVYLDSLNFADTTTTATGLPSGESDNCSNDWEISYRDSTVEILANQVVSETFRIWTISDRCNNSRTRLQAIVRSDTILPSYVDPPVLQVDCEHIPDPDTIDFWDINDVVSITMNEVVVDTPCIDRFTIVRTWTAVDGVGNVSSVDQVISVTSCNTLLVASITDTSPCFGEFIGLISQFNHATHEDLFYPRWYQRADTSSSWVAVAGGDQKNISFPAYPHRSGEYQVVYDSDPNHLSADECRFRSNIITLDVTGEDAIETIDADICEGDSYVVGDSIFTTSGNYNIVFSNDNGCDSIVTLILTVHDRTTTAIDVNICYGDFYETLDGTRITETSVYGDTLTSSFGCDSILLFNVVVQDEIRASIDEVICDGGFYDFHGDTLYVAGMYTDTLTASSGCDSIVTLDLQTRETVRHKLDVTICEGTTYFFDGIGFTADTQYERTFGGANGCDSIVTLDLKVSDEVTVTSFDTTCYQQSYRYGNRILIQSDVIRDTFTSAYGCDSIHVFHLHMLEEDITEINVDLCAGDVFQFKDNSYSSSQVLREEDLKNRWGCDSIVVYNLNIGTVEEHTIPEYQLCAGDSIQVGSNYVQDAGTYTELFVSSSGCEDSLVRYNVALIDPIEEQQNMVICNGDSVLLEGAYQFGEGTYVSVLSSSLTGCDSVVITNLVVEGVIELWSEDVNVCFGSSFNLVVDGADNLTWTTADDLSCNNCPNPSGYVEETTTFTATTAGCAGQEESIDVTVNVFEEVQLEVLTPDTTLTYGESLQLNTFISDPFTPITWYDANDDVVCTNCSQPEVNPTESGFYYAEANTNSDCVVRDTVHITIKDGCAEGEIFVPNFISPNGDGSNDDLRITSTNIRGINKIRIFNRWGQVVFRSSNVETERWDGTVGGVQANPGVYVYFLEYQCLNGDEVFQKGNITLLK